MSNVLIRPAIVRVDSKKVAELHQATLSVMSGDSAVFGADGYLGHSQGAGQAKLSAKVMVPVAGLSKDLPSLVINKKRTSITFFVGGKEYQIAQAAAVQFQIDSETQTGVAEGSFEFEGGPPTVIG